jgi:Zn-dependent protease
MLFSGLGFHMLYLLIALLFCISVHEASHALVAYLLGDPTAKERGRLTLKPWAHLSRWGTLSLLVVGLGWGKPVPVDPRRMKHDPQMGMALVGIVGPLSNLLLASILALPLRSHWVPFGYQRVLGMPVSYGEMLSWIVWLNLSLAVFNLIPMVPLDGSRIWAWLLPRRWFLLLARYERIGLLLIILLIVSERFTGLGLLTKLLFPPIEFLWWQLVGMTPPFQWQ